MVCTKFSTYLSNNFPKTPMRKPLQTVMISVPQPMPLKLPNPNSANDKIQANSKNEASKTDFIFESGAYGSKESRMIADGVKTAKTTNRSAKASRFKRIADMIFLPYGGMCIKYPVVKKVPILLPVFWVVRWVNVLLFKRSNSPPHLLHVFKSLSHFKHF